MSNRKKYHVTQSEDGTWKGRVQGGKRASVVGSTKAEVVKQTIELAKKSSESQVIIHKIDGKIQEERTYGSDPNPPEG